jgi:hypothetical protein
MLLQVQHILRSLFYWSVGAGATCANVIIIEESVGAVATSAKFVISYEESAGAGATCAKVVVSIKDFVSAGASVVILLRICVCRCYTCGGALNLCATATTLGTTVQCAAGVETCYVASGFYSFSRGSTGCCIIDPSRQHRKMLIRQFQKQIKHLKRLKTYIYVCKK